MMMNLFSVFDPVVGIFQFNWVSGIVVFLFIPMSYYMMRGMLKTIMFHMYLLVSESLSEIVVPYGRGIMVLGMGVFLYLMMNNILGLFSFVFTATAHPMFTLSMGLVYWLAFVLMGWIKGFKNSIGHLVPEGSPLLLAPVLVLIELISHLIRPFTLSIRLAANMMAGHLIMGLLSSISLISGMAFFISVILQLVLYVLEWAVALIQAMVFSILMLLYVVEYY